MSVELDDRGATVVTRIFVKEDGDLVVTDLWEEILPLVGSPAGEACPRNETRGDDFGSYDLNGEGYRCAGYACTNRACISAKNRWSPATIARE